MTCLMDELCSGVIMLVMDELCSGTFFPRIDWSYTNDSQEFFKEVFNTPLIFFFCVPGNLLCGLEIKDF